METKMTCMNCRRGCTLEVSYEGNRLISVTGNGCGRGKAEKAIPKEKFSEAEAFCKGFRVPIPIRIGDVLVNDFCQTGVRLIALKSIR